MLINSIQVTNFRPILLAELVLDSALTLIVGPNGSGKSSLLEAIYLLGRGRSFRTARLATVIRRGAASLRVVGQFGAVPHQFTIGIEAHPRRTLARLAGQPAESLAALSIAFPVQVIEPGIHKLIEEGPTRRRRYLDWGVFHVEPHYLQQWQRFHRTVRQRNAALRGQAPDEELDAWDRQFVEQGEAVTSARGRYLDALRPFVLDSVQALMSQAVNLDYAIGWPSERTLAEALRDARPRDRHRKVSSVGPQRADLILSTAGCIARDTVSRGQQKLLASALILGQLAFHARRSDMHATLLLDDPAAELDGSHLATFMAQVRRLGCQVVATSLRPDAGALGDPGAVFHVEQGAVTRL